MGKISQRIGLALCAMILLFSSCSNDEGKVIPRDVLADIYTEMLVTDQWILSTPGVRMIADTSLVYVPILEKYGYTTVDYMKTVEVYMADPERFAKIFRTSGEMLDARIADLKEKKKEQEEAMRRQKELMRLLELYKTDFKNDEFFPYLSTEPYVHYYDSLTFEPDTLLNVYRLVAFESSDSTLVLN